MVGTALLAALALASYVRDIPSGAGNILLGGPTYFGGAFWLIGLAWFQVGMLLGLLAATAWYTRRVRTVVGTLAIIGWLFVLVDACSTFTVP